MSEEFNERRAVFVLGKIDEILSWEKTKEQEKDARFVELGEYLCEVRAKQFWKLENLKSFDEFLEKRFPDSRRKAYYLMAIHEHLPRRMQRDLKAMRWCKARELVKVARREGERFDCAPWVHKASTMPREEFKREVDRFLTGRRVNRGNWSTSNFIRANSPSSSGLSKRLALCWEQTNRADTAWR